MYEFHHVPPINILEYRLSLFDLYPPNEARLEFLEQVGVYLDHGPHAEQADR